MEYNREWEYGTPSDCDCQNNFIEVDCGCKSKDVCECENILFEISKLKSEDIVLQREIDAVSGVVDTKLDASAYTPVDMTDYYTKSEVDEKIPSLSGYATEEYVNAQISSQTSDFVTGEQLSSYTYDKATIDSKIPSMSGYVTMEEFGDYIMRLRSEIDTLRQQVSGCCEIPPTPTPTGDTDCVVRIKYTQGEDFVIPCEESYIGNLESFELPSPYTRPNATAVTVGNCTGQIGQTCFEDFFQLQTVYISSACTSIRQEAFYGCSALTAVTIEATTPPTMVWNNTFQGCTSLQHIYVPAASVNAYKTAQYWDTYANLIEPIV